MTGPADRTAPPFATAADAARAMAPSVQVPKLDLLPAAPALADLVGKVTPVLPALPALPQPPQAVWAALQANTGMSAALRNVALFAGAERVLQDTVMPSNNVFGCQHEAATGTRRFMAAATAQAQTASTIAEFGDALRALHTEAGLSQNELAKHFGPQGENIVGLSKTRISAACNGYQLFQKVEQVEHVVIACEAEADLEVWVEAYFRVKKNGGRRERGAALPARNEPVVLPAASGTLLSGPDDEVVHVLQVPITRGQVRAALAIIAALGVVASTSSTPAIRAAGLTALGFAAATAMADQATRQPPTGP